MSGKFMMNGIEYLGGGSGGGGGNVDDVYVNGESVLDENKIAQVTSYKEVTLAEYMALPDTKLNDGIMYCIKDVGGANQFPPLIYSDEEREIGVWRDGKPLYQKTINIQDPSHDSNWHDISHGISNPDIFANINGVAYWVVNANTIAHVPIPSRDETNTANYGILIRIVGSNLQYAITGYGSTTFSKMFIILQYTKTTDTPGSGTWTTQGALAHHYSTDEHIIGTWVDGKPIYEKSWEFDSYILISTNGITSLASKDVVLSDVNFFINAILISKVDKRVYNTFAVGYFSGSIGVYNPLNADAAIDKIILQYTKTTD